jgi:DNA-binding MarR family transcriptional regulator
MRLEDEIKQSKFMDEYHKLAVNLIYTSNWVKMENTVFLKHFGLTSQQFNILRILRGQYPNPTTVNLLIDRMLDKMSNASRLVEKLRLKKLVVRQESKSDRRQADVLITEKGLELLAEIDKRMDEVNAKFKGITEAEAKMVNDALDKMRSSC